MTGFETHLIMSGYTLIHTDKYYSLYEKEGKQIGIEFTLGCKIHRTGQPPEALPNRVIKTDNGNRARRMPIDASEFEKAERLETEIIY